MSYPRAIEKISGDMYVDDLTSGYNTVGEVQILKQKSEDCFQSCFQKKGAFTQAAFLHTSVENTKTTTSNELTYAKEMFQASSNETKILRVPWNKMTDRLSISTPKFQQIVTNRNIVRYVALIYDLLGIISPFHVLGKVKYIDLYDEKIPWDAKAPVHLKNKFVK